MPRPLRIQYEGAWYHVMNRGAGRKMIFTRNEHRHLFLSLLEEATRMFGIEVHAYCLMGNHYHLLLRTPLGNLSRAMRHINGLYTQRYNRIKKTDGTLFRGRYKSILVEDDNYLLAVSRYIHLNPVDARLVTKAEMYLWSSYKFYLQEQAKPDWLLTSNILEQIDSRPGLKQLENYQAFVEMGNPQEVLDFYSQKYVAPIFGTEKFKKEMLTAVDDAYKEVCSPDIRRTTFRPKLSELIKCVAEFYAVKPESLFESQRGQLNWAKLAAIYIARKIFGYSLPEISEAFQNSPKSTVSGSVQSAIKLLEKQPERDDELRMIVQHLNSQCDT